MLNAVQENFSEPKSYKRGLRWGYSDKDKDVFKKFLYGQRLW